MRIALILVAACSAPIAMDELPPEGKGHGRLRAIGLDPPSAALEVGERVTFSALAVFEDGHEADFTAHVRWESSDDAIASFSSSTLAAHRPGKVLASGVIQSIRGAALVDVAREGPAALAIPAPITPLLIGEERQLEAIASYADGATADVSTDAVWSSSAPSVARVERGRLTALAEGRTEISARYRGASAAIVQEVEACRYPRDEATGFGRGDVLPAMSWPVAFYADCTVKELALKALFCDASDRSTIAFVVEPRTAYLEEVGRIAHGIDLAGSEIVWIETLTAASTAADSVYAHARINGVIANGPGIRVGDADTHPTSRAFSEAGVGSFVVRRRDMRVIARQADATKTLPYIAIALDPDADWSRPDDLPFSPRCGPLEEEPFEPNDAAAQAAPIGFGSFTGGICSPAPDFYRVDVEGEWLLLLEFTHAIGDIDLHVWNDETDAPLTRNGNTVGSTSGDDDESLGYEGVTTIRIIGYESASAPYRLTLLPRF
jgi:hypothetical protein